MENKPFPLEQCKEYLKNVVALELSCYQQKELIGRLKQKTQDRKDEIAIIQRKLNEEAEPTKPDSSASDAVVTCVLSVQIALLGAFFGLIAGLAIKLVIGPFLGYNLILYFLGGPWKPYLLGGIVIGAVLGLLIPVINLSPTKKRKQTEWNTYSEKLKEYNKTQEERKRRIAKKTGELRSILPQKIAECESTYQRTKNILHDYYKMNVIYSKYHGLVPISTIYEYLDSGRCFTLYGYEGAYNLYEKELRMNLILGKLDDVIDKLDEISYNQRVLVDEIRRSNQTLDHISSTLDNIEHNTALTQYYSGITASNTTYLAWLEYNRSDSLLENIAYYSK